MGVIYAVGSPTDRKFLYANTFLFAMEFRLSVSTVNLIVTNYIFTQLFQKTKTHYARKFSVLFRITIVLHLYKGIHASSSAYPLHSR